MEKNIENTKLKLRSALKLKQNKGNELCILQNQERVLQVELDNIKAENEFINGELEDIKNNIVQVKNQRAVVEICWTSEKLKIDAEIINLQHHRKGFQKIFDYERALFDRRLKEIQNEEEAAADIQRQKQKEIMEKTELQARELAAIEAECEALEQESVVLKKRNKAVMLQLRRKLLETENARREMLKKMAQE